ncbi:MAG: tetratricopeptide repeat protein, partial [Terriglobia bacterium]
YQLAASSLKDAVEKSPNDPSIHYHLGLTYQKLGEQARAKLELERALQLNPKFKDAAAARQALGEVGKG